MSVIDRARDAARAAQAKVVFPELTDPRVAEAARQLERDGLCTPVPVVEDVSDTLVSAMMEVRGTKEPLVRRLLQKPLYRAAAMVRAGLADAMVAGADSPTRRVIEAASMGIGLSDGVSIPSSYFLMVFPDGREFVFADCAVNVSPDAVALEAIARASEATGTALLGAARVALLSFSTGTSGAGDSVEIVRSVADATGFTGPIQADAALNAGIAQKKGLGAGDANVLIFPSLDAGNIAYKLCQELGGAQAIGPFLQGFRHPVCDLSRGATVEDIVAATLVTIALASVPTA
ncbi:phosphate acyltransferase [uncultured Marivita sp.]|uniref:phosphate acyltransferase n=1 Tax=uncultured Marivita sp. TaxID=888080 RepID=UPI00261CB2FA|nr:phosphate acyltransferase [uncultured Marivita sp.]